MKLLKLSNLSITGKQIFTVPTNSSFLLGVKPTDEFPNISISKNGVELSALSGEVNGYTAFEETTGDSPSREDYLVTLSGTKTVEVPKMGRTFTVQIAESWFMDFDLPIDDAAYWDPVNHPLSVVGTSSRVYNNSGQTTDTGVPTLTFDKINTGKLIIYKVSVSGYQVSLYFLLQFIDIENMTFTPFPEGFVPGWDNADETLIGRVGITSIFTRTPYQGEKQVGTETVEVPVTTSFPVQLICKESSIGYCK